MKQLALLAVPLALAACNQEPEPEPAPTPTAEVSAPRTLIAADLDLTALGPKIEGPQGTEVETVLSAGNREIGRMVSYVACPEDAETCVPGDMPEGTVYTYVHRITLADADESSAEAPPSPDAHETGETGATLFRTTREAAGFVASIGYSSAEAEAALGFADAISITADSGQLIWRVTRGEGWKPGTAITFWWQSTVPPQGPEQAYLVEVDGEQAQATGPFPAAEDKAVEREPTR